jgi:hypothetical protein
MRADGRMTILNLSGISTFTRTTVCQLDLAPPSLLIFDSLHFRFSDQPGGQAEPVGGAVIGSPVPLAARQQHDLAEHAAFAQHLVRVARLFEGQPLRDQGLDRALFEQVQQ